MPGVPTALRSPRVLIIASTLVALAAVLLVLPRVVNDRARTTAANPVTPGGFTGLGFDQCQAPKQSAMDTWIKKSPFRAVGIYISGDSRGCRTQTYLNATWVAKQLAAGWHLLPITLGPQASCQPRFPRYKDDFRISAVKTSDYAKARSQGTAEGTKTVTDARALGLVPGSTLFYDLEGYDYGNVACRDSALRFVSAWTARVKALGYRAGLYSSVGSGMKMVEAARVKRPANIVLPDAIWLARYDGKANTSATDYLPDAGWQGARIKQFQGGHNETWGGVTINIDRNYLALAAPAAPKPPAAPPVMSTTTPPKTAGAPPVVAAETHCPNVGGAGASGNRVDLTRYQPLRPATASFHPDPASVRALTCLLRERTSYTGPVGPRYSAKVQRFVVSWRRHHGLRAIPRWTTTQWMWLLAKGPQVTLKATTTGARVRDVQRALNASNPSLRLAVNGYFTASSLKALRTWRAKVGAPTGTPFGAAEWRALRAGRR